MAGSKIRTNYIYNVTFQILSLLTPFITTPYISRVLMADGVGLYSFTASLVHYFVLFAAMGISIYGQREVSYLQDNRAERSRVFWNLKCLSVINVTVCLGIYFAFIAFYVSENLIIYVLMSMYIINVACDVGWMFAGMEDFRRIVLRNIVVKVIDISFVFIFIKKKSDLPLYVFGILFFSIAANLSLWTYLPLYIDKPRLKELRPFNNIKVIWSLFIPTIAINIYTVLDKTMIGFITGNTFENGYYEQAMKIAKMALTLITSLGAVMIPRIGYLFSQKDFGRIQQYMYTGCRFVMCLGIPLCIGLGGISDNFVSWFFGPGFDQVAGLLKVSSFIIPAIGMNYLAGSQYLIPTRRQKYFTISVITGAAVNFTLNIFLIRSYGAYGAAAASVAAESIIALVEIYIVRKEVSFIKILFSGIKYYISGAIMFAVLRAMNSRLTPSPSHTFAMIFAGAGVYVLMLLMLRDEFFMANAKRPFMFLARKSGRTNPPSDD